jgi:uncharacterized protein
MRTFNNMMLILTEGCNLRCPYCYESVNADSYNNKKTMPWPIAKKALDLFFNQIPEQMVYASITFFGGEPTLKYDLIRKVIETSFGHRTLGGYIGNKANYIINTNGTILSGDMFDFFSKLGNKLDIRISVDGYKSNHDRTRKTIGGSGSWILLEKNLSKYKVLKTKFGVRVHLSNTINKSSYEHIYENYKNLYELSGMQIGYLFVHEDNWEYEDFEVIKKQVILLHDYCLQQKMRFPLCNIKGYSNPSTKIKNSKCNNICAAGVNSFTVSYNGNIYPCHRSYFYGLEDMFKLGNIDTGFDYSKRVLLYEVNDLNRLPLKCQMCNPVIRKRCHVCFASNKHAYGDYFTISDNYCLLMKELYYLLLEREYWATNEEILKN